MYLHQSLLPFVGLVPRRVRSSLLVVHDLLTRFRQGRRQSKPKQKDSQDDSSDGSKLAASSTPTIAEPKPRSGRPIELKALETKELDGKDADTKSSDSRLPPRQPATSANASRPFPCVFAQYNCGSAFTSKNEWKRHISTKHIQLGFWRCDMCPPSPGIDHPVYNDFNRKDLFTQHLRRMHASAAPAPLLENSPPSQTPLLPPSSASSLPNLTEEQIIEIQKRCFRVLRQPPDLSNCVFCPRTFHGPNSWEERLEHVGGHLERDRKNGTTCLDVSSWRPDPPLRDYLVTEGLVEVDPRGGYKIGDGKPKRPLDIEGFAGQAPTAQLTPRARVSQDTLALSPGGRDGMDIEDSESSTSKRRRGRPPKRVSDVMEIDIPAAPMLPQQPPVNQPLQSPREPQQFQPPQPGPLPNMHHQQNPGQAMSPSQGQFPSHSQFRPSQPQFGPPIQHPSHPQYGQHHGPPPGQHHGPPLGQHQGPPPGPPQYQGPPQHLQSPRDGGPPPGFHGQQQVGPPISPRQYQLPPANLQNMYKFEHGSFTKFAGTSNQQPWPPVQRPPAPEQYPPPHLATQRAPGQPQLAPKPAPDPVQEIMSRIYANAPQLAPKPLVDLAQAASQAAAQHTRDMSQRPPSQNGPPQQFHSGFRPINEQQQRLGGPIQVAPKPTQQQGGAQEGGRQLAPKPVSNMTGPYPPFTGQPDRGQPPQPLSQQHPGPPPQGPQHHSHASQTGNEPQTPGASGPHLAPAPSPSQGQPPSLPHSHSHSHAHSQPGSPPQPQQATPKQTEGGAERDDASQSARGRSFRDIVMS